MTTDEARMNRRCANCGMNYGKHTGNSCPGPHKTTFKQVKTKGPGSEKPRVWDLQHPDEVLELANKIHEAMVVRERIPDHAKPTMRFTLEVIYEQK